MRRTVVVMLAVGACAAATTVTALPAAAITSAVNTDSTASGLAANIAVQAFPTGAASAVVTVGDGPTEAQAGSLAAETNAPLLVSDSTDDASAVIARLQKLASQHVTLVAGTTPFSDAFSGQLTAAGITVDQTVGGSTALSADSALVSAKTPSRILVADTRNPADLAVATNLAISNGFALAVVDGTETDADLGSFFGTNASIPVTLYGDANAVADHVSSQQASQFDTITTEDPLGTQMQAIDQIVGTGRKANRIFASPSDSQASIVANGLLARSKNGVSVLAGPTSSVATAGTPAATDLKLWASEAEAVTLTGVNATAADATALAKFSAGTRTAAPAWRVTDTTVTSTNFKISFTAYTGATKYVAYDLLGNTVGTSTTPSLTITGNPVSVAIAAQNSAGKELKRMEYELNRYLDATDRESAVVTSTVDASKVATIQVLGALSAPRTITRTMTDPYNQGTTPVTVTLATTCQKTFSDTGLDTTKEYTYDVVTEGGVDNQACKSTASANPDPSTSLQTQGAGVLVPSTTYPPTAAAAAATSAAVRTAATASHAAMPTINDTQLMEAMGKTSPRVTLMAQKRAGSATAFKKEMASAATAAGPNYEVRWFGFIQGVGKNVPLLTSDQTRPFLMFGGDNHGPGHPDGSHRVQADIQFYFQSKPQTIKLVPNVGDSHEYFCASYKQTGCKLEETKNAGTAGITLTSSSISGAVGTAQLRIHSALPFLPSPPEPAIDVDMKFRLQPGNSTMVGYHDAMPTHEVYSGLLPGDFARDYLAQEKGLQCLFPLPAFTGCQVHLNRSL